VILLNNLYWRWVEWRERYQDTIDGIPHRSIVGHLHAVWQLEIKA